MARISWRVSFVLTFAAAARLQAQTSAIATVGPNVQVSRAHPSDAHYEVLVAADPNDARRMIVGSFRYPPGGNATVVYATRDGGATWQPTLDGASVVNTSDPAPAFGPDGWAYYTASLLGPSGTPREARKMLLFSSADGGLTWSTPSAFTYSDRQYLMVDGTSGPNRGRLYVNGNNRVPYGISDFVLFRSSDRGKTWSGPATRPGFGKNSAGSMGNAVIASDGTIIGIFEENGDLKATTSTDGGASLTAPSIIDTSYVAPGNRKGANNNVTALPFIAIDPGNGPNRDHLYVVWADRRGGHSRIYISTSPDKGASWTAAQKIDDTADADSVDNWMPNVAVNKDGVVGVVWYDRRSHPDNMGWDVRFTASTDGGKTFMPSIKVSEHGSSFGENARYGAMRANATRNKPEQGGGLNVDISLNSFVFLGGDTAGMVADAAGVFHPVWIDNHSGTPQVWTAPVRVRTNAIADNETDVSDKITIDVTDASFDRATGSIEAIVRLQNTSSQAVNGPFTVRLRSASSDLGTVTAVTDTWTITEPRIAAGARTAPLTWRFTLSDIQPFRSGNRYRLGLLKLNAVVLAPKTTTTSQR